MEFTGIHTKTLSSSIPAYVVGELKAFIVSHPTFSLTGPVSARSASLDPGNRRTSQSKDDWP